MHPRMQELLNFIDEQYAAFRAAAEAVPDADRERQPEPGRWSVAQVVDHVSRVEAACAQIVAGLVAEARARGTAAETETGSVIAQSILAKTSNRARKLQAPEMAYPADDARFADAMAALETAHGRVRETFAAADGVALDTVRFTHPALGPLDAYQWGVAVGGHEARHALQIREAAETLAGSPAAAD